MRKRKDQKSLINSLFSRFGKGKAVTLSLAIIVVLLTSYVLILPGAALEQDAAEAMPGFDVETAAEEESAVEEEPAAQETEAEADADNDIAKQTTEVSQEITEEDKTESSEEPAPEASEQTDQEVSEESEPDTEQEYTDDADPPTPPETTQESVEPEQETAEQEAAADEASEEENEEENKEEAEKASEEETQPADGASEEEPEAAEDNADTSESGETEEHEKNDPLVYKVEGYTVTVVDESSVLPEDTEIRVQEISSSEHPDEYEKYYKDALAALQAEKDGERITDFGFARFYDITLVSNGEEISKPGDSVSVRIEYDKAESRDMSVDDPKNVRIIHFAEDEKTGETEAEPLDNKIVEVNTDKSDCLTEATFEAEGFSVYAIVSTEEAAAGALDGKSYGILNNKDTVSGTALMTNSQNNGTRLGGKTMTVKTEPVDRTGIVFVAKDSEIAMWKFISAGDNKYYISTEKDGTVQYLRISDSGVSLVAERDDDCLLTITEGTGSNAGKIRISRGNRRLRLNGSTFESSTSSDANTWMNLAELSDLKEDDFVTYTATKVSISDTVNVPDGAEVIVYTRIWNDDTKRYEYYAIDYDGMLVRAYESGNTISWVGTKINTMLWDFTEYHYEGTSNPNYYYELQNQYSGKYIAPQITGNTFLSDSTIGINLNGRRNGEYYSTIMAWDDEYYDYAALSTDKGQLTSSLMSKASDFYFAIMTPVEEESELTTVATIDHKPFGITLKMQDYERITSYSNGYRSAEQVEVLGNTPYNQWTGSPGLLEKNLTGDYPNVKNSEHSLSELYDDTLEVNQQFLLSTYEETGYFEYDSTQNFCHLITSEADPWYGRANKTGGTYGVGDFVIYDELGTSSEGNKDTLKHGQFLPYNDILAGFDEDGNPVPIKASTQYVNEKDIHAKPLSSLDPRNGEALYEIPFVKGQGLPKVDHYFGMEMSARFMQSENGLDAWGHDLIFEFSGDDDFWLYIDGKLVLDLGGIHSALDGSINFRTGKVVVNGKPTDLRTLYKEAYLEENPEADDDTVNAYLNEIFEDDGSNTGTVFKDYSGHTMRMFYMERGAGASNIHMRFNLAAYTEGEVLLEKEVSGTDSINYTDVRYPFQIWYKDKDRPGDDLVLWTDQSKVTDASDPSVLIPYSESAEIGGRTYGHVFYLKPGQTASIKLPDEDTEYYIRECGMDSETYDAVYVNGSKTPQAPTEETAEDLYRDYETDPKLVSERKKVIFDNHVSQNSLKKLTIVKKVWADDAKQHPWEDDTAQFKFRIYIGKKNGEYSTYGFGKYYVRNPDGEYCFYSSGGFVSSGKTVFEELSSEIPPGELKSDQDKATFYTSQGGMADKIPAGYFIEIPGLTDGTPFLVEERDGEIPAGYQLIDYDLEGGVYNVDPEIGDTENYGVISSTADDPIVTVNNRHGYGLTVKKNWADKAFMKSHDDIYFAVYVKDGETVRDEPLEGSVRCMHHPDTSYTWFFRELEEGKTLNDYLVYEVVLSPEDSVTVDPETGEVSGYETVTRVEQGGSMTVGGVTNDHGYSANFEYTADYDWKLLTDEELAENVNERTDTVTNSRPGIRLVKTDLEGNPLKGGVFTMKASGDSGEGDAGEGDAAVEKTFVSDANGLIAVAYLQTGRDYVLAEKASPDDHLILIDSVTIRTEIDADGNYHLLVNGSEADHEQGYYSVEQVSRPTLEEMPTVTIRNKPYTFKAIKTDAESGKVLRNVEFTLYPQKTDHTGAPIADYRPVPGFESLITDDDGVIPKINEAELDAGSYYLREKEATSGYKKLAGDIHFTITAAGEIVVENDTPAGAAEVTSTETDSLTEFVLNIKNTPKKSVHILKKSMEDHDVILPGAKFELYSIGQIEGGKPKPDEEPIVSGETDEDGILGLGPLDEGVDYYLFETEAPEGYSTISAPVIIKVTSASVSASLDGKPLEPVKTIVEGKEIWTITVYDSASYELPESGGIGTTWFYIFGSILVISSGVYFAVRRRIAG